jgi:hypothetical protein
MCSSVTVEEGIIVRDCRKKECMGVILKMVE